MQQEWKRRICGWSSPAGHLLLLACLPCWSKTLRGTHYGRGCACWTRAARLCGRGCLLQGGGRGWRRLLRRMRAQTMAHACMLLGKGMRARACMVLAQVAHAQEFSLCSQLVLFVHVLLCQQWLQKLVVACVCAPCKHPDMHASAHLQAASLPLAASRFELDSWLR